MYFKIFRSEAFPECYFILFSNSIEQAKQITGVDFGEAYELGQLLGGN